MDCWYFKLKPPLPSPPFFCFQSIQLQKPGKWCAVHVQIAWQIYHHQQKIKVNGSIYSEARTLFLAFGRLYIPTMLLPAPINKPKKLASLAVVFICKVELMKPFSIFLTSCLWSFKWLRSPGGQGSLVEKKKKSPKPSGRY